MLRNKKVKEQKTNGYTMDAKADGYLLERLLVGGACGLQEADHVFGALHHGGLDPQMVAQLLDAHLERRHEPVVVAAVCPLKSEKKNNRSTQLKMNEI